MPNNEPWIESLYALAYRFQSYGVTADLASLNLAALWGLYCFLRHLAADSN